MIQLIAALKPLARYDNVALKASGLPCALSQAYSIATLRGILDDLLAWFGPRRVFWGSDLTRLPCSYRQAITMFTEEIPWLTSADKEWIMGRGLCEWIAWKLT